MEIIEIIFAYLFCAAFVIVIIGGMILLTISAVIDCIKFEKELKEREKEL